MAARRPGAGMRALVLGPPFLWLAVLFLAPFAIILKISLSESALAQPPYRPLLAWTTDLAHWRAFFAGLGTDNYALLATEPLYGEAALSSLAIAAGSTALLLAVGYPVALALARAAPGWRPLLLAMVVVPFWTSLLIRVYAWIAILKPDGWLTQFLLALGLAEPPPILDTNGAVLIGIVYAYLPFMILPIYASLDRADPALLEAAGDLGASPRRAFWTVTVPLSLPGVLAGALLCFIPITGEFVIPDLLGGSATPMLGRVLWSEFFSNRDWPLASAAAIVLTLVIAGPVLAFRALEARRVEAAR